MEPSHHNLHLVWRGDSTAVHELQWYISRAVANEGFVPALMNSHASAMCISTFAFALSPTRRRGRRRATGPMGSSRCGHPCPRAPVACSARQWRFGLPGRFHSLPKLHCMLFIGFKELAAGFIAWRPVYRLIPDTRTTARPLLWWCLGARGARPVSSVPRSCSVARPRTFSWQG